MVCAVQLLADASCNYPGETTACWYSGEDGSTNQLDGNPYSGGCGAIHPVAQSDGCYTSCPNQVNGVALTLSSQGTSIRATNGQIQVSCYYGAASDPNLQICFYNAIECVLLRCVLTPAAALSSTLWVKTVSAHQQRLIVRRNWLS